jgi:Uma2 family endonuclease
MTNTALLTAEEYALLNDDRPSELICGRVYDQSFPGRKHGRMAVRLASELDLFVEAQRLGEVYAEIGYITRRDPDSVRGPDISFVGRSRVLADATVKPWFVGAPDLAIEIRSPDNTLRELYRKAEEYLAAGGTTVWIVEPDRRQVQVIEKGRDRRTLGLGDELDGGTLLPGFTLSLSRLFRP